MDKPLIATDMPDLNFLKRGKVRDIYDLGDTLLLVATDRISAFDVVLPNGIPGKGALLNNMSVYWFRHTEDIIKNHLIATDVKDFPEECRKYSEQLEGRSMLVKKAGQLPVECVVRGYLAGSGWKEYQQKGSICGIELPLGLQESSRIAPPIFTPSTKADKGHDINITFEEMAGTIGIKTAEKLRDITLSIYKKAAGMAEGKGIIIADTKFEFGIYRDELILIDEALTPDSSRFWSAKTYEPGKSQDSYDKQIIRDYLLTLDWDRTYPGPVLPDNIVGKAMDRYREIFQIITG